MFILTMMDLPNVRQLSAIVNTAPARLEVAASAAHDILQMSVGYAAVLTVATIATMPAMNMVSSWWCDGSRNGRSSQCRSRGRSMYNRKRTSEIFLIPLWACASLPCHTAKIAELMTAATAVFVIMNEVGASG
jgi:hypothetical protein